MKIGPALLLLKAAARRDARRRADRVHDLFVAVRSDPEEVKKHVRALEDF